MILLDTHIWIWWVNRSPQQTPQIIQHIQNHQQGGLGISLISCWEVAKLVEIGKLQIVIVSLLTLSSFIIAEKYVSLIQTVPPNTTEKTPSV